MSDTDAELVMAYADGELDALSARRLEQRLAVEPELAARLAEHRRLKAMLDQAFAGTIEEPVPEALSAPLRNAARVVPIGAARRPERRWQGWMTGGAVAAALVLGLFVGQGMERGGAEFRTAGDRLIASGTLARALDTQLAADQPGDAPQRMLASFTDNRGSYCRVFAGSARAGIACRTGDGWSVRALRDGGAAAGTDYRQAGSSEAAILATAQEMMAGEPLSAADEAAARARGWQAQP